MSFLINNSIPESDLPVKSPSSASMLRYVENGKSYSGSLHDVVGPIDDRIDALSGSLGDAISGIDDRIDILEISQGDGVPGVANYSDIATLFPSPTAGQQVDVLTDPDPAKVGRWGYIGGAWVRSADRVTGLEQVTADIPRILGTSPNLFDAATATDSVIVGSGGNTTADPNRYTSDFIPVKPSTQYTFSPAAITVQYAFYNASKGYIAPFGSNATTFTTPATAAYVRVSPRYSDWPKSAFMLVEGASLPSSYAWWRGLDYLRLRDAGAAGGVAALDSDAKLPLGLFDSTIPETCSTRPPSPTEYTSGRQGLPPATLDSLQQTISQ